MSLVVYIAVAAAFWIGVSLGGAAIWLLLCCHNQRRARRRNSAISGELGGYR